MPVAKLSPISQATISITPWMPKVNMAESTFSPVKLRMPSQVVQPPASESRSAALPRRASRQFESIVASTTRQTLGTRRTSAAASAATSSAVNAQLAAC